MPAEWESHEATWLTWPTNRVTWPGPLLKEVENIYLQMIAALLPGEKVHLLIRDKSASVKVRRALSPKKLPLSRLHFHEVKTVDTWIRDYGPIFVRKVEGGRSKVEGKAFTKWIFNAWGGKYSDLARDNKVVDRITYLKKYHRIDTGIVLEGGSIDVNGLGTCLTTEQCLLTKTRNPKFSKKDIENALAKYLGVKKVIWLKDGIEADDTDGHVDDITRFIGPRTVVTAVEPDRSDKNHEILNENLRLLKKSTDQDGKPFQIVELPMPGRVGKGRSDTHHNRLPASYANFYIGNKALLLPLYSHANDQKVLKILKSRFRSRKMVSIECTPLVYGLGSIHCVTQQEPVN